jgi:hypothetical protein
MWCCCLVYKYDGPKFTREESWRFVKPSRWNAKSIYILHMKCMTLRYQAFVTSPQEGKTITDRIFLLLVNIPDLSQFLMPRMQLHNVQSGMQLQQQFSAKTMKFIVMLDISIDCNVCVHMWGIVKFASILPNMTTWWWWVRHFFPYLHRFFRHGNWHCTMIPARTKIAETHCQVELVQEELDWKSTKSEWVARKCKHTQLSSWVGAREIGLKTYQEWESQACK